MNNREREVSKMYHSSSILPIVDFATDAKLTDGCHDNSSFLSAYKQAIGFATDIFKSQSFSLDIPFCLVC